MVDKCRAMPLNVPTIDRESAWLDSAEGPVAVRDYWARACRRFTVQGTTFNYRCHPGDTDSYHQPSTHNSSPPRARVTKDTLIISYSAVELKRGASKGRTEQTIDG